MFNIKNSSPTPTVDRLTRRRFDQRIPQLSSQCSYLLRVPLLKVFQLHGRTKVNKL